MALRPSLEIVYSLATGYDLWAASKSLTDVNDDPLLNADGDSAASNVLEYAFNLNPLVPDAVVATPTSLSGLPLIRATAVSGGTQLEAVFLRRKDTGNGLTYETQFSDGLASWQTGGTPTVQAIDASWERVTVKDSAPVSAGHRFARVKVTLTR